MAKTPTKKRNTSTPVAATNDQRADALALEARNAFTVPNLGGAPLLSPDTCAIKGRQMFLLFRAHDDDVWMQILKTLLPFSEGHRMRFKVCRRYITREVGGAVVLGYLWELTLDASNLTEALDKFRRIMASCIHDVLGGLHPNYPEHAMVEAESRGELPTKPDTMPEPEASVVIQAPVAQAQPSRGNRNAKLPNLPPDNARGVAPANIDSLGNFSVGVPNQAVAPANVAQITDRGAKRNVTSFEVTRQGGKRRG